VVEAVPAAATVKRVVARAVIKQTTVMMIGVIVVNPTMMEVMPRKVGVNIPKIVHKVRRAIV